MTPTAAPIRPLFVATLPEPGGAAAHLVSLTRALASEGESVTVIATPGRGVWEGIASEPRITGYAATFQTRFDAAALAVAARAIAEQRPDHLFAVFEQDYWGTLWLGRRHGLPVTLLLHHAGMRRTNRLLLPFARPTYLVPSDDLRRWISGRGIPRRRVHRLSNPIDTAHFRPDAAARRRTRQALGFGQDDVVVGYVGRFEANKGILPFADALLAAMAHRPTLRGLWVGFGRREAELAQRLDAMPARHVRLPWAADPLPLYQSCDIVVLPSTQRESFGRVLVEAQACGVPVIGSAIGGIPDTMRAGETGLLVAPGDRAAWTDAVLTLAADPERRAAMGAAGRAFVAARFDSRQVTQALRGYLAGRRR